MLDYFRSRRNPILLYFVVGLVCLVMLSFGLAIRQYGGTPSWVLKVDGEEVPTKYYLAAFQQTMGYFQSIFKDQFNPELMKYFPVHKAVIENLKEREVVTSFAKKLDLVYSPEFVKELITQQDVFKDKGTFSFQRYKHFLARGTVLSPITPKDYERYLGQAFLIQTLNRTIRGTYLLPKRQKELLKTLRETEFKLSFFQLDPKNITAEISVGEKETKDFANNQKNHTLIQNAYYAHIDRYTIKDSFEAKHILIAIPGETKDSEVASLETKANEIYQTLLKHPDQFEDLAKKHSDDPGSKEKGGDLGRFSAGDMVKPLEDALRKLTPGSIAPPVKSDLGFHIPKLVSFTKGKKTPMESVKTELAKEVLELEKKKALISTYGPIIQSHFQSKKTKEVARILDDVLKIKAQETAFFSPYQAQVSSLGKAFALKKWLVRFGAEATKGDYVPEVVVINNTSYVFRIDDKKEAFADQKSETGKLDPMDRFLEQMVQRWQDHIYVRFKRGLMEHITVEENPKALDALKKRAQEGRLYF